MPRVKFYPRLARPDGRRLEPSQPTTAEADGAADPASQYRRLVAAFLAQAHAALADCDRAASSWGQEPRLAPPRFLRLPAGEHYHHRRPSGTDVESLFDALRAFPSIGRLKIELRQVRQQHRQQKRQAAVDRRGGRGLLSGKEKDEGDRGDGSMGIPPASGATATTGSRPLLAVLLPPASRALCRSLATCLAAELLSRAFVRLDEREQQREQQWAPRGGDYADNDNNNSSGIGSGWMPQAINAAAVVAVIAVSTYGTAASEPAAARARARRQGLINVAVFAAAQAVSWVLGRLLTAAPLAGVLFVAVVISSL